jgi:DNA end-binding protein Ku
LRQSAGVHAKKAKATTQAKKKPTRGAKTKEASPRRKAS